MDFNSAKLKRKEARLAEIPIIAMTAYGDTQSKAMQIGAKDYLKKPFSDLDTILRAVARIFPKQSQ